MGRVGGNRCYLASLLSCAYRHSRSNLQIAVEWRAVGTSQSHIRTHCHQYALWRSGEHDILLWEPQVGTVAKRFQSCLATIQQEFSAEKA